MSAISDSIEQFIITMITNDGSAELQRNKMATEFGCAPSQINYVLSTRFTVQRGYVIESRRGGGGYIRILRIPDDCNKLLISAAEMESGDALTKSSANDLIIRMVQSGAIEQPQAVLMKAALSDEALECANRQQRDRLRACIFSSMAKALAIMEE